MLYNNRGNHNRTHCRSFFLRGATWEWDWGGTKRACWFGLVTGFDALYLSFAEVTNTTFGRPLMAIGGAVLKS